MVSLWQAKHVKIAISDKLSTPVNPASKLYQQVTGAANTVNFESVATEANFTEPEISTDVVQLLGSAGTPAVQNSILVRNPPEDAEFTATLLLNPRDGTTIDLEKFKLTATAVTDVEITKRYNYASDAPTTGVAVAVRFQDDSATGAKPFVTFLMNDCIIETLGGVTVDAEGNATQEIRIKSAANNTFKEWGLDA